jgi:osmoprotectant transport system substrate-binding protein
MSRWLPTTISILVLLAASCGGDDVDERAGPSVADGIRVASFDFAESALLAEMYAQVIESSGVPVVRLGSVGPREIIAPAIELDLIDFVPEYLGAALARLGAEETDPDVESSHNELNRRLSPRGMTALGPSPAEDVDIFVVTADTADRYDLETLSDLAVVAPELTFRGTTECPHRALCLLGLEQVYGIEFAEVTSQQSLRFRTEALRRGEVDVAQMFSTASELEDRDLVVLDDDLDLQPAQNITPLIRTDALERWGRAAAQAIDAMSDRLTTRDLRQLNLIVADGGTPEEVAHIWLTENGLVRRG